MKADLIRMENGKKDLPTGVSRTKDGSYRLQRTVAQKDYRFGSFRNLEHALRVNAGINVIVEDLRKAQAMEGYLSIEDIEKVIVENGSNVIGELTSLIDELDSSIAQQFAEVHKRFDAGMYIIPEKKTFWQRVFNK